MTHFFEVLFVALMLSSTYVLIAVGFTLFFGAINIVHFAHGDVAMLGAFVAVLLYSLFDRFGITSSLPLWIWGPLVAAFSLVVTGLLGLLIEQAVIKPFRNAPMLITLVATVALGIFLRESVRLFYPNGSNPEVFPPLFVDSGINIGTLYFRLGHITILGLSLLSIVLMVLLIERTRIGLAIRAISQNVELARLSKIDVNRVVMVTFLIGSVLAGLAGILIGSYYSVVKFDIGIMYGIKGFSAAVVGGLGHFYGAILGGLILGLVETFASAYVPEGAAYKDVFAFLLMLIFLVFRPSGILAERKYEKV